MFQIPKSVISGAAAAAALRAGLASNCTAATPGRASVICTHAHLQDVANSQRLAPSTARLGQCQVPTSGCPGPQSHGAASEN